MKSSKFMKALSLVLGLCMLLTLLAACGSQGGDKENASVQDQTTAVQKTTEQTEQKPEAKPVTITLLTRYSGTDPQALYLQEMMELFKQKYPNVTFQDDSISEEAAYFNKISEADKF